MRVYKILHPYYYGVDLHARTMFVAGHRRVCSSYLGGKFPVGDYRNKVGTKFVFS